MSFFKVAFVIVFIAAAILGYVAWTSETPLGGLSPGDESSYRVRLDNAVQHPFGGVVFLERVTPLPGDDSVVMVDAEGRQHRPLDPYTVVLTPNSYDYTFVIVKVPDGAASGEYIYNVIFQNYNGSKYGKQFSFRVS